MPKTKKPTKKVVEKKELIDFFQGDVGQRIKHTFALMEIAESEIVRAQERYPSKTKRLHRSFLLLMPNPYVQQPRLYRRHCRALLRRIALGKDTRAPTRAEIVGLIAESSLAAPATDEALLVYGRLFRRLFPKSAEVIWSDADFEAQEHVHGKGADEVYRTLLKKMYQKDRVLQTKPKPRSSGLFD